MDRLLARLWGHVVADACREAEGLFRLQTGRRHPVVAESSVSRDDRRSEHGGDGLRRSRLKGGEGARVWTGWAVLTYNVETYGLYT